MDASKNHQFRLSIIFLILFALLMLCQPVFVGPPNMKAPWTAGISYRCEQGNLGAISHSDWDTLYAWDFKMPKGSPVKAVADGIVHEAGFKDHDFGNIIKIKHFNGYFSLYAHLSAVCVRTGEQIISGQTIGYSGDTGSVTAPHLHFSIVTGNNFSVPSLFSDIGVPIEGCYYSSQNWLKQGDRTIWP